MLQALLFLILSTSLPLLVTIAVTALTGGLSSASPTERDMTPAIEPLVRLAVLTGVVLSVWLAGRFLDRRRFADFGWRLSRVWWADLGFGLFLGAALMCGIFALEWAAGWITISGFLLTPGGSAQPFLAGMALALLSFIGVGIQEELLSRGYQLKNLAEGLRGPAGAKGAIVLATVLSSALFGYLHASNPNATTISTLNITLAGVFLALGMLLTGELAIPTGIHITWNFFQGNVFGFPVSGLQSELSVVGVQQGGSTLVTGGVFGPEAGLIGIGAMLLGCAAIVWWVKARHGRVALYEPLAEPELRARRGQVLRSSPPGT